MELEYIQDAYTNKSYKVIPEDESTLIRTGKKKVTFDSKLFLDEIFSKAIKYANKQGKKVDKKFTKNCKLYVGIDIVSYGSSNAKMAYVSKNRTNLETKIDLVDHHIGNLKLMPSYDSNGRTFKIFLITLILILIIYIL